MTKSKPGLYVMWHEKLEADYFQKELASFSGSLFFLKAASSKVEMQRSLSSFVSETDLAASDPSYQKRGFMASSMILNALNAGLHNEHSHIGFLEYDIELNVSDQMTSVGAQLNSFAKSSKVERVISFSSARKIKDLESQTEITIRGENAITSLYKALPNPRGISYQDLLEKPAVTQQSFFLESSRFEDVVLPVQRLVEAKFFEQGLNTWHRPSTLLERAFAVQLALQFENIEFSNSLHNSQQGWSDKITWRNYRKFLASFIRRKWNKVRLASNI